MNFSNNSTCIGIVGTHKRSANILTKRKELRINTSTFKSLSNAYEIKCRCKIFWQKKMTVLPVGLDEISTFVEGKVVKKFFGFTMLTQKNVQIILARLLWNYIVKI